MNALCCAWNTGSSLTSSCNCTIGKSCFLCENEHATRHLALTNECTSCSPPIALPKNASRVLEHMSTHILFDSHIKRSNEPCGLCLRPAPLCRFYLKRGKGAGTGDQIDFTKSTCIQKMNFSYSVASVSTSLSPSSNVPLRCPICPAAEPCVWRYNNPYHRWTKHPTIPITNESHWQISNAEKWMLKDIWDNRHKEKKARKSKKYIMPSSLVISEAHSSHLTLQSVPSIQLSHLADQGAGTQLTTSQMEISKI